MATLADVSAYLLDLHESSNDLGHREVQERALQRLRALVPFDSGLLGVGTVQDGIPRGHDVVLFEQPPEMMASWDAVKHEDRVASWAFAHPGETGSFAVDGPIFDGLAQIRAHCARFGMAHVLCTALHSRESNLYWAMSLYRCDPAKPFSEDERRLKQLVVPHLFAAARRARLGQLRARAAVDEAAQQAAAIVNRTTRLVLEADPAFAYLLRRGFEGWSGPFLPSPLGELLAQGHGRVVAGRIVVRVDTADTPEDIALVHVRSAVAADALTARERAIAEAFAQGETHREIGDRFGVSPNTVRRHIANVYEKLGISSKAELDGMIRDT